LAELFHLFNRTCFDSRYHSSLTLLRYYNGLENSSSESPAKCSFDILFLYPFRNVFY
jgi:hypothetical protein